METLRQNFDVDKAEEEEVKIEKKDDNLKIKKLKTEILNSEAPVSSRQRGKTEKRAVVTKTGQIDFTKPANSDSESSDSSSDSEGSFGGRNFFNLSKAANP